MKLEAPSAYAVGYFTRSLGTSLQGSIVALIAALDSGCDRPDNRQFERQSLTLQSKLVHELSRQMPICTAGTLP